MSSCFVFSTQGLSPHIPVWIRDRNHCYLGAKRQNLLAFNPVGGQRDKTALIPIALPFVMKLDGTLALTQLGTGTKITRTHSISTHPCVRVKGIK